MTISLDCDVFNASETANDEDDKGKFVEGGNGSETVTDADVDTGTGSGSRPEEDVSVDRDRLSRNAFLFEIADCVTDDVVDDDNDVVDGGRFIVFTFKLVGPNGSLVDNVAVVIGVTGVVVVAVIEAPGFGAGGADGGRIINDVLLSLIVFGETGAKCDVDDVGDLLISDAKLALLLLLFEDGCENGIGDGNGDAIVIFVGVAGFENENGLSRKSRTKPVFID